MLSQFTLIRGLKGVVQYVTTLRWYRLVVGSSVLSLWCSEQTVTFLAHRDEYNCCRLSEALTCNSTSLTLGADTRRQHGSRRRRGRDCEDARRRRHAQIVLEAAAAAPAAATHATAAAAAAPRPSAAAAPRPSAAAAPRQSHVHLRGHLENLRSEHLHGYARGGFPNALITCASTSYARLNVGANRAS